MGHQILQTADYVMIMAEYLHEARIVRLGAQHLPAAVRQWQNLHVVERFKPIEGNTFLYRATVEDPSVFSKPWVIEYPFARTPGTPLRVGLPRRQLCPSRHSRTSRKFSERSQPPLEWVVTSNSHARDGAWRRCEAFDSRLRGRVPGLSGQQVICFGRKWESHVETFPK
jgi:hypothetical protein